MKEFFNLPPKTEEEPDLIPFKKGAVKERVAEGSHADVYAAEHAEKKYVVKIGKAVEYSPPILNVLKIKFPREKISNLLERCLGPKFKIMPDEDFIRNGVAEYMLIKEYFGNDPESSTKRNELLETLNDRNSPFFQELSNVVGAEQVQKTIGVLEKHQNDNFLAKEQVIIGHPPGTTAQQVENAQKERKNCQ